MYPPPQSLGLHLAHRRCPFFQHLPNKPPHPGSHKQRENEKQTTRRARRVVTEMLGAARQDTCTEIEEEDTYTIEERATRQDSGASALAFSSQHSGSCVASLSLSHTHLHIHTHTPGIAARHTHCCLLCVSVRRYTVEAAHGTHTSYTML